MEGNNSLTALAVCIIILGIVTSIGATILLNYQDAVAETSSSASSQIILTESTATLSPIANGITSSEVKANNLSWLEFDGVNDVVEDNITLNYSNGFSYSAWVNINSIIPTSERKIVVSNNLTSSNPQFNLVVRNSSTQNRIYFRELVNSSGCDTTAENATTGETLFHSWHHLVGTYNADSNNITLHIDGVLQSDTGSVSAACKDLLDSETENIKRMSIGGRSDSVDFFDGGIDEVRIYNKSLSQSEVTQIYNAGRVADSSLPSDGLVLWYSFDEAQGQIVYDKSGNGNDGV